MYILLTLGACTLGTLVTTASPMIHWRAFDNHWMIVASFSTLRICIFSCHATFLCYPLTLWLARLVHGMYACMALQCLDLIEQLAVIVQYCMLSILQFCA